MRWRFPLLVLLGAALACAFPLSRLGTRTQAQPAANLKQPRPPFTTLGVRICEYVPGTSTVAAPLAVTPATPTPYPLPELPANTSVPRSTTERQLRIFQDLWDTVNREYIDPHFHGRDWRAIGRRYRQLVQAGLSDDDFYFAMDRMLWELGDDHSVFESPQAVQESDAEYAGGADYAGIGIIWQVVPEAGYGVIVIPFPDSPAAAAGLRAHDIIEQVDGEPVLEPDGTPNDRLRGPEGSLVILTVRRPGGEPFVVPVTRRHISGGTPVDFCLIQKVNVGYLMLPGLDDRTIGDRVREALTALTAAGPLAGLVVDNRENGGGADTVLVDVLRYFVGGYQGDFVSRSETRPLTIEPADIGGSQSVPLVVLVDEDTASFGEVMSGVLQNSGRAKVVGRTTLGNVETLWGYTFEDGSRAWIAHDAFQPLGLPVGLWEDTGIVPDVSVPTRWDLFTEATDPALARAVDLLLNP